MAKHFKKNFWGKLSQFEIPHAIVHNGVLTLKGSALKVLLVLFEAGKAQQRRYSAKSTHVEVKISQKTIGIRSNVSKNVITKALKQLELQKFIRSQGTRTKQGEFGVSQYTLCNPGNGLPLLSPAGRNFFVNNHVQYIKMPIPIVRETDAGWSIAAITDSASRMYVALCWLANRKNKAAFDVSIAELKKLSGLSKRELAKNAVDELGDRGLLWYLADTLQLRNPYTGEPSDAEEEKSEDDPSNYWTSVGRSGRVSHWEPQVEDAKDLEKLLIDCGCEPIPQNSGEYKIVCPFHADQNPSCSVNPTKQCFYCFGCCSTGTVTSLVAQLRGVSKGDAIQYLAERTGQRIEFHEPDKNATIYSYRNKEGKLIKDVLRYPDKQFSQRRRVGNAWAWNVDGLPPMLYNLNQFIFADAVIICEGEKDCATIAALGLFSARGAGVIATTSGNADSWADQLAEDLRWKKVVIMPDADEPGERYRAAIEASLKAREIEYRVVSFKDVGAKDISDFMANGGTAEDLVRRIGTDWVLDHEPSRWSLSAEEIEANRKLI